MMPYAGMTRGMGGQQQLPSALPPQYQPPMGNPTVNPGMPQGTANVMQGPVQGSAGGQPAPGAMQWQGQQPTSAGGPQNMGVAHPSWRGGQWQAHQGQMNPDWRAAAIKHLMGGGQTAGTPMAMAGGNPAMPWS